MFVCRRHRSATGRPSPIAVTAIAQRVSQRLRPHLVQQQGHPTAAPATAAHDRPLPRRKTTPGTRRSPTHVGAQSLRPQGVGPSPARPQARSTRPTVGRQDPQRPPPSRPSRRPPARPPPSAQPGEGPRLRQRYQARSTSAPPSTPRIAGPDSWVEPEPTSLRYRPRSRLSVAAAPGWLWAAPTAPARYAPARSHGSRFAASARARSPCSGRGPRAATIAATGELVARTVEALPGVRLTEPSHR